MSILFYGEDVEIPLIDFALIQKILKSEIRLNKYKLGIINYIFCSDQYLLKMNNQFLNHDYFTDVITFDYTDGIVVSGDIYISTDMVLHNSVIFNQNFIDELVRVISHGLFHLLNFGDKESDEIILMRKKEDEFLQKFRVLNI